MKSKIIGLLFSGLFALAFGAGGFFGGLMPLWDALQTKWRASSLVSVDANVLEVKMDRGDGTRGVRARYAYTWQGTRYASERISLQQGTQSSDNLSDWHDRWYRTLTQAKERNGTVTAWLDPNDPANAVLDREMRWAKVWFAIPFAFLFTGVGIVATWVFVKLLMSDTSEFVSTQGKPVTLDSNPAQIRAVSNVGLFFFGLIWSLLSVPMCVMAWTNDLEVFAKAITTLFAVIGVWMMFYGLRSRFRTRKSISPTITLSPQQPEFGDSFRARIHVPHAHDATLPSAMAIALAETVRDERGSSTTSRAGVQRNFIAKRMSTSAVETIYEAIVEPPAEGHASGGPSGGLIYSWAIEIAESPSIKANSFSITLLPPLAHAKAFQKLAIDRAAEFSDSYRELKQSAPDALTTFVPASVCTIRAHGREWEADFPARGMTAGPNTALFIAALCLGWFFYKLIYSPSEVIEYKFMFGVAAIVGLLFIGMALHFATRRFRVSISTAGLFASRASILFHAAIAIPLAHLKNFSSVLKYTQTGGARSHEAFSAIHAFETRKDIHHRVTPTLGGIGAIDALIFEMNDALDNVRPYGITPTPRDTTPQYSLARRTIAWTSLAMLTLFLVGATYALLYQRHALFTPLVYARAEPYPVELTAAQFKPSDPARHDAIMQAINGKDAAAMKRLLAEGIDVNTECFEGSALLHMAVAADDRTMIDTLIDHGADLNRVVTRGQQLGGTPLSVATYKANASLMQHLIKRGARSRGLVYYGWDYANLAAFSGCIECLKVLKREGIDLDAFAPGGRQETPIMTAARYGKLDVIRFLANEGASLTKRDPHGYNAVGWAHFFKQEAAKKLLLELGADPDTGEKR